MPRRSKKAVEADAPPPRRSTRTRKSVLDQDEVEVGEPARKKPRGKRASAAKVSYEEEDNSNEPSKGSSKDDEFDPNDDVDDEEEKPKTPSARGRGRGRRPAEHKDTPAPKPAGRGRGRKRQPLREEEEVEEEDDEQDDEDELSEKASEQSSGDAGSKTSKKQKLEEASAEVKKKDKKSEATTLAAAASDAAVVKAAAAVPATKVAKKEDTTTAKEDVSEKKDSEKQPSAEGEKKKDQVAIAEVVPEGKAAKSAKASSTDASSSEEKKSVAEPEKPKSEASPVKDEPARTTAATKEETKPELPAAGAPAAPASVSEPDAPKETTSSSSTTEETKEKARENGITGTTEAKGSASYEANAKADAPTEKDLSVASVVAPTAASGAGDVAKETREILDKTDGAEVVAVQKATPAAAEAAESCGFRVVGSGATRLLFKPGYIEVTGAIETGPLGELAYRELDGLSSQAYRANVEAYLATHCCPTDEFMVVTLSARGKSLTVVNVQMETKNPSVAALLVGCLMRQLDSRPHAFIVTGHMPHVQPDSPAYELLRDGYFGNRSIEALLCMQDIRMDAEDEWDKGLIDFLWKAYQHSRPWMRSVYETVLNGETPLSSTGRSMVWHSTKGVGVVGVLNHSKLVRADLAIYIRDS